MARLISIAMVAAVCALALAPSALAQSCEAPPGTSAIDEYCESLPGPGGDRGPSDPGKGGQPLSPGVRAQLKGAGSDGQALLGLVGKKGGRSTRSRARAVEPAPSDNPLSAVKSAIGSGSTAGPALVWVLLAVALLLGGFAWVRYRRGERPEGG